MRSHRVVPKLRCKIRAQMQARVSGPVCGAARARFMNRCSASICPHAVFWGVFVTCFTFHVWQHSMLWYIGHQPRINRPQSPGTAQSHGLNQNGYSSIKHAYQSTRNAHVIDQCCVTTCSLAVFLGGVELWVLFHVLRTKHETCYRFIARVTKQCIASICPHAVFCGGSARDGACGQLQWRVGSVAV